MIAGRVKQFTAKLIPEDFSMYRLALRSIRLEGDDKFVCQFMGEGGLIEFSFTASKEPFTAIKREVEFERLTNDDPAALLFVRGLMKIHEAVTFEYDLKEGEAPPIARN